MIEPSSEEHVIGTLAAAMVRLGSDADEAERLLKNARAAAEAAARAWTELLTSRVGIYNNIMGARASDAISAQTGSI